MDEVNPEAVLATEAPVDYYAETANYALLEQSLGWVECPMRVALPTDYRLLHYGYRNRVSAATAALHGVGAMGSELYTTRDWSAVGGLVSRHRDAGPLTRWHELHATFRRALVHGYPLAVDPSAPADPRWVGRLWNGGDYFALVGGHLDGSRLSPGTRVVLPGLPSQVRRGVEFDVVSGRSRVLDVDWTDRRACLVPRHAFVAVLLPLPGCPALLQTPEMPRLAAATTTTIPVQMAAPWRGGGARVNVVARAPGLSLAHGGRLTVPGALQVTAPPDAIPGSYPLTITGDCLPLKRWIRVRETADGADTGA